MRFALLRLPGKLLVIAGCLSLGGLHEGRPRIRSPNCPVARSMIWQCSATSEVEKGISRKRQDTEAWWRNFNDPVLNALVVEAQQRNPGIRPLLVTMVAMMFGTFLQVVAWGCLFLWLGEFTELYEAVYHSTVNICLTRLRRHCHEQILENARPTRGDQWGNDAWHERCCVGDDPAADDPVATG